MLHPNNPISKTNIDANDIQILLVRKKQILHLKPWKFYYYTLVNKNSDSLTVKNLYELSSAVD